MTGQQIARLILQTPLIDDGQVLSVATQGVIDFFASSLHAVNEPEVLQFKQWIENEGGRQTAWLIGQKSFATARQAALLNGFQAHFLDYDDVHSEVRGHPSAVILAALFAGINRQKTTALSARRLLTAYVIGVEIMARLGASLNPYHYGKGWHSTATLGTIGATAAVCYLHNYGFLDQALALAATQTGGLRLLFGTPIKSLHAGLSAQSAIQCVEWLQAGLSADKNFLDEKIGFTAVYGNNSAQSDFSHWGENWRIFKPGLWFKTYSYCSAAAYIADACEAIYQNNILNSNEIENIELIFSPQSDTALIYSQPEIKSQGRFSAEYIAAKILLGEPLDFGTFPAEKTEPHIVEFMKKMHRTFESREQRFAAVKVRLKNGKFLQHSIIHPKGSPRNPYSTAQLQAKLTEAVGGNLSRRLVRDVQNWAKTDVDIIKFIQTYGHQL